jgi:RNA polymerase sigma-70 factor (ECF subfamily)
LAQEALLEALRCPERIPTASPEEQQAWIKTVLVRMAYKVERRHRRAKRDRSLDRALGVEVPAECLPDPRPSPADQAEHTEEAARLAAVVDGLTEKQRQAVRLRYWEDLVLDEIGTLLGVSRARVSALLRFAQANIAERLDQPREGRER